MSAVTIRADGATELVAWGDARLAEWYEGRAVDVPGAEYTTKFQQRKWDGKRRPGYFLRERSPGHYMWRGPRGYLDGMLAAMDDVTLEGLVGAPTLSPRMPDTLRDYQRAGLLAIFAAHWCRVSYATNAGKGAVIALASEAVAGAGMRVLVLADEVAVFGALLEQIEEWTGITPGVVEAGVKVPPDDAVVVAMIPTLYRRAVPSKDKKTKRRKPATDRHKRWQAWLGSFQMVLLDEADKATADTWTSTIRHATGSLWRVGFSGTFPDPDSVDELDLEGLLGPVADRTVKNAELIERGISAHAQVWLWPYGCRVHLPPARDWYKMTPPEQREYVYDQAVTHNADRHRFIASLLPADKPSVIVVERLDHGAALESHIEGSVFLHGAASRTERDEVLDRFRRGEFRRLIVTRIMDRGTNELGHAVVAVFASAQGSERQTLQRLGRVLRRTDDKTYLLLFDIIDSGHDFLVRKARERVETYREEGLVVRVQRRSA